MKQNKINKVFPSSIKIWSLQLLNMFVFILIAFIIFIISKLLLGYETIQLYDFQVKIFIVLFAYIGLFLGTHNAFKKINKSSSYLPKTTKYLIILYQTLFILLYSYFCYLFKYNVILFLGGYISIYIQFFFNTIYTYMNNKKYPKIKFSNEKINEENLNDNEFIINVNKLK